MVVPCPSESLITTLADSSVEMNVANIFSLLVIFNCSALTTPSIVTLSVTFKSLNEPLSEPLKSPVISVLPLTLSTSDANVKFAEESTPCVELNKVT